MTDPIKTYFAPVDAFQSGDDAATRALIGPDFVMHEDEGMPCGGTYRGPDGFFELVGKVWSDPISSRNIRLPILRGTRPARSSCSVGRRASPAHRSRP